MSPSEQEITERRSANYAPSIWTDAFIQSRTTEYLDEKYVEQAARLKERVRGLLVQKEGTLLSEQLELIDVLQRLGLSHHFDHEIQEILSAFNQKHHNNNDDDDNNNNMNLYQASLLFRLLRQQGYPIPQGMFKMFLDDDGNFEKRHSEDVKGVLSLYEASYLGMEGEEILEKAKQFCIHHLNSMLQAGGGHEEDEMWEEEVRHALEMPLHWRMPRLEARHFIDVYQKRADIKTEEIVELAKLEYNMVQAVHLKELKELSKWHKDIQLAEAMGGFARSRLVAGLLWSVGVIPHPKYEYARNILTKISEFVTMVDDVYDVYATLREAETLTHAIQRWDVNAIEEEDLPSCVKVFLLALFNYVNQMVYDVLIQLGINVLPYLKQAWVGLAKAYLAEAKWYHGREKPSLKEYLDNGWVSISAPLVLTEAYVGMAVAAAAAGETTAENTKEKIAEDLQLLLEDQTIIRYCATIFRLSDDLGTSSDEMERGDVPKAVQCHMNDNPAGCSEEDARGFIRGLIQDNWRKMNTWVVMTYQPRRHFFPDFVTAVLNLARTSQLFYQYGDGVARQDDIVKQRMYSVFFHPI